MDAVDAAVELVTGSPGRVVALELEPLQITPFVTRLHHNPWTEAASSSWKVRLVLGEACTTLDRAAAQLVTALQLPYEAAFGWRSDFTDALDERGVSARTGIVVADASAFLKYEEVERWKEVLYSLASGPHCMGGGYTTVVLVDSCHAWSKWPFARQVQLRPGAALRPVDLL